MASWALSVRPFRCPYGASETSWRTSFAITAGQVMLWDLRWLGNHKLAALATLWSPGKHKVATRKAKSAGICPSFGVSPSSYAKKLIFFLSRVMT